MKTKLLRRKLLKHFQHCHLLIIFDQKDKPRTCEDVDNLVCAEIPDRLKYPALHEIIANTQIHKPCGALNPSAPCMINTGRSFSCTKKFPKPFNNDGTRFGGNYYPNYRRRDPQNGGNTLLLSTGPSSTVVDNSYVIPYNPVLSELFAAHINVEIVHSVRSVKYLCKYQTKGNDKTSYNVNERLVYDEIEKFQTGRYISSSEAYWRIYGFNIMEKYPPVNKLALHLEDEQQIIFEEENAEDAVNRGPPITQLLAFFILNQTDIEAKDLIYPDIFTKYTWNAKEKRWKRRIRNCSKNSVDQANVMSDAIGRLPVIALNPRQSELFYLRMLLYNVKGPTSFGYLRTVDHTTYDTFREACFAMGLLADDNEINKVSDEDFVYITYTNIYLS